MFGKLLKEKIEDNLLELNDGTKKLEKFNKEEGRYINICNQSGIIQPRIRKSRIAKL